MAKKIDKGVFLTDTQPSIISSAAIVGGKEGKGPLGKHFDKSENGVFTGRFKP
jgi:hypothetical protein